MPKDYLYFSFLGITHAPGTFAGLSPRSLQTCDLFQMLFSKLVKKFRYVSITLWNLLAPPLRYSVLKQMSIGKVAMTEAMNASRPFEIEDHPQNDDPPENQIVTAGVMPTDSPIPQRLNWTASLPASSFSVMVVVDGNGCFQPLYTAGDLLRWCKSAWRAEQD